MVLPDNIAATNRTAAWNAAEENLRQKRSNTPILRVEGFDWIRSAIGLAAAEVVILEGEGGRIKAVLARERRSEDRRKVILSGA